MIIPSLFIKQTGLALTLKRHSVVQKTERNCRIHLNCRQFYPLQYQDTSELGNICWSFILCVKFMFLPCPRQDPSVSIPYLSIIVFSPFLQIHPNRRQNYLTSTWYNPFKSIACIAWHNWKCWKFPIVQFIQRRNYLFIKIKHLPLLWVQYWYMTFPQIVTNYKNRNQRAK